MGEHALLRPTNGALAKRDMRLTKQTNYAIRLLMYCAANEPNISNVRVIARSFSSSEKFMFKVLKILSDNGLMHTIRGRNGGVKLARRPNEITILDVVKLTEENFLMAECFDGGYSDCPMIGSCVLNQALSEALAEFFSVLNKYTIEDLAKDRSNIFDKLGIA